MKKLFRFLLFGALALTSVSAASIAFKASLGSPDNITRVDAADSMNPPDFISTYSTPGQNWSSSGDPTAGQSSDYATYSTSINSSTTGFSNSIQAMTVTTGKDDTYKPYIQLRTGSTKEFRAMYVPFKFQYNVPSFTKATYNVQLTLYAARTNADGGGADYSSELFYYGETAQVPNSWFYHQDDFTTSTGRGFSEYRVANGTRNDSVSYTYTKTFSLENKTGSAAVKNVYFGIFCYMESSNYSGIFTGKVTANSCTYTFSNALATLDNSGSISLVYTPAEAVSKFNAASGQTMTLVNNIDFSDYGNPVYTVPGTINLQGYDILLGTHLMYVSASITFTGTTTAEIKGSAAHSVLFLNTAATVHISGYVSVKSENTSTPTARAILVAHANADLYLDEDAYIYSNYYGVQIDNGTFHCQGRIFAGIGQNADVPYAINIGSSDDALKNVYLYGANCRVLKINTGNLAKSRIYAKYSTTPYTAGYTVNISISNSFSVGDIVVRNVTTSGDNRNDHRFLLSSSEYQIYTSGTNKIIQWKRYDVTYTLNNCTTNGPTYASKASNLSFTITPDEGFALPNTITITRGGETLTQGTHYTYNNSTGAVVVTNTYLTAAVNVTAYAQRIITVRFLNTNGEEIADSIVHVGTFTLNLPKANEVIGPAYHSLISWYTNPELEGTHFGGGYSSTVYSSTDYYAQFLQSNQDLLDHFVDVELHFVVDVISTENNNDTNACRSDGEGAHSYYAIAKDYYQNTFTNALRQTFCTDAQYEDARLRLNAWANANGERLNLGNYQITAMSKNVVNETINTNVIAIVIISSILMGVSVAAFFLTKRRKHQK